MSPFLYSQANESQAPNYGCIVEDPETNEVGLWLQGSSDHSYNVVLLFSLPLLKVMHYVEKPETFVSSLINAGAYLFTPVIFETLSQEFRSNYEESTK